MTDTEKIEKLAEWMGWQLFERKGFKWWATLKGKEVANICWNPLACKTAPEAARAISEVILEAIE